MSVKSILFVVSFNADISMFIIFCFYHGDLLIVENEVLKSPTTVLELIVVYIYYVFYEIRCTGSELCSFNGLSP